MTSGSLALLFAAAAVVSGPISPCPGGRWRGRARPAGRLVAPRSRAVLAGAALAAAVLLLAPGAVVPAIVAGLAAGGWIALRPGTVSAAEQTARREALAVHADLLASCLRAGMATGAALPALSEALAAARRQAGELGDGSGGAGSPAPEQVWDAIGSMLALGADAATAWRPAAQHPDLAPLAEAAGRSFVGGVTLADAAHDRAVALRADIDAARRRAAGRAAVLVAAPLGLCFLPAFLCLGLAPVVIDLVGRLSLSW